MNKNDFIENVLKEKNNKLSRKALEILYNKFKDIKEIPKNELWGTINYYWQEKEIIKDNNNKDIETESKISIGALNYYELHEKIFFTSDKGIKKVLLFIG